ncbi:MAG: metal ABC transporter permease [Parachlamydiaceae bacterium]|nr:metal ABC transporter permease [Parachlamydiaceae bacterium]
MLMCLVAALIGSLIFLRKQSLIGEALSHAAYPGVIIGALFAGFLNFDETQELYITLLIMLGAFCTALMGLWIIHFLETKCKIHSDAALCFILASFFGIGLTLASEMQFSHTSLYRQSLAYLYGQSATMTDLHILIYGSLSALVILVAFLIDKELQTISFDRNFATSMGIPVTVITNVLFFLTTLTIIISIRSVGVVLMSAMLIAPAAAARQYTNRFHHMLALAALFGMASGFFGTYSSIELTKFLSIQYPNTRLVIPTGPMIILVASFLAVFALLFAPERGLILRLTRILRFRHQCIKENILKSCWRIGPTSEIPISQIAHYQNISPLYLKYICHRLVSEGWLKKTGHAHYILTNEGILQAAHIVRLHRLWEVYLASYLDVGGERIHRNAEEMEHILTPELEQELTLLLNDPKEDPHHQKIPPKEDFS